MKIVKEVNSRAQKLVAVSCEPSNSCTRLGPTQLSKSKRLSLYCALERGLCMQHQQLSLFTTSSVAIQAG